MSSKRGAYSGIFVIEEPRRSAWLCDFSEARLGADRYFLFWYLRRPGHLSRLLESDTIVLLQTEALLRFVVSIIDL